MYFSQPYMRSTLAFVHQTITLFMGECTSDQQLFPWIQPFPLLDFWNKQRGREVTMLMYSLHETCFYSAILKGDIWYKGPGTEMTGTLWISKSDNYITSTGEKVWFGSWISFYHLFVKKSFTEKNANFKLICGIAGYKKHPFLNLMKYLRVLRSTIVAGDCFSFHPKRQRK